MKYHDLFKFDWLSKPMSTGRVEKRSKYCRVTVYLPRFSITISLSLVEHICKKYFANSRIAFHGSLLYTNIKCTASLEQP